MATEASLPLIAKPPLISIRHPKQTMGSSIRGINPPVLSPQRRLLAILLPLLPNPRSHTTTRQQEANMVPLLSTCGTLALLLLRVLWGLMPPSFLPPHAAITAHRGVLTRRRCSRVSLMSRVTPVLRDRELKDKLRTNSPTIMMPFMIYFFFQFLLVIHRYVEWKRGAASFGRSAVDRQHFFFVFGSCKFLIVKHLRGASLSPSIWVCFFWWQSSVSLCCSSLTFTSLIFCRHTIPPLGLPSIVAVLATRLDNNNENKNNNKRDN